MNIQEFLQTLRKNILYLILFPALLAGGVYFLTKDKPVEYHSTSLLYTGIVSGYNLNNTADNRIDYNVINNAFDNITSIIMLRDVAEETSINLLAKNLMAHPGSTAAELKLRDETRKLLPPALVTQLVDHKSHVKTVANITNYIKSNPYNPISELLESKHPYYGIKHMQTNLKAARKSLSDIIEITYTSENPSICYQTLQILSGTVIKRYKEIKLTESANVVTYFEKRVKDAKDKLDAAEQKLTDFGVKNRIINYDEQSKSIAYSRGALIENIEKEKMLISSAQASLNNLNEKLNMRKGLLESNNDIVVKRQKLANLNFKISNAEVNGMSGEELEKNKVEAEKLKAEIKDVVGNIYQQNNSQEGIQGSTLLSQWLSNVLTIDESNARLSILTKREREFDSMYDNFAPMGSILASLQREVGIAEKEYLEVLNALNQSTLKRQNISYSSNLKIIEPPSTPFSPNKLKNQLLVVAAFVCGVILLIAFFLVRDMFDSAIKTPERVMEYTGIQIGGTLPLMEKRKAIDMNKLETNLMEQAISAVLLELQGGDQSHHHKRVIISSLRSGEGKTWYAHRLANKLSEMSSVLLVTPKTLGKSNQESQLNPEVTMLEYVPGNYFIQMNDLNALTDDKVTELNSFEYVIIEIPALTERQLPVQLMQEADLSVLVLNAERKWNDIDNSLIELFKKASRKTMVVLNKISIDKIKSILGDVPKARKKSQKIAGVLGEVPYKTLKSKETPSLDKAANEE